MRSKSSRRPNPKELPGTGFDFKNFFQSGRYFEYSTAANRHGGAMQTHNDDFGKTTDHDQSYFYRDEGHPLGGFANATIRTIGEETSNQVTQPLHSIYGRSTTNHLQRDQATVLHSEQRGLGQQRYGGQATIPSESEDQISWG